MSKIEKFFTDYKNTITIISGLLMVISFFIAADNYINNEIERKITDKSYLDKLARTLRPFAVFDEKGVIQYDHGGEKYIEKIEIMRSNGGEVENITVTTKNFLQNSPILFHIGYSNYAYTCERIGTYQWKFNLSSMNLVTFGDGNTEKFVSKFIIEITN